LSVVFNGQQAYAWRVARRYRPYRATDPEPFWWAGALGGLIVGALGIWFLATEHKLALGFTGFLFAVVGGQAVRRIRRLKLRKRRSR